MRWLKFAEVEISFKTFFWSTGEYYENHSHGDKLSFSELFSISDDILTISS